MYSKKIILNYMKYNVMKYLYDYVYIFSYKGVQDNVMIKNDKIILYNSFQPII